jgi:hypothetical protein
MANRDSEQMLRDTEGRFERTQAHEDSVNKVLPSWRREARSASVIVIAA